MRVNVVAKESQTNSKTGQIKHYLKCLAEVQSYGNVGLDMISVQVLDTNLFKLGEQDLDIILPKSDYPYALAKKA